MTSSPHAGLRDLQQQLCCDALLAAGPDAPTLCEGWTARHLAIHLWQLNHDPVAWLGMLPGLGRLSRQRYDRASTRMSHDEVVEEVRSSRGRFACMPDDGLLQDLHSLGEWYVHTQDVLRANDLPQPVLSPRMQDALWRRTLQAAPLLQRAKGLVLERETGERRTITKGETRLVVKGQPSELILWVYGRQQAARVTSWRRSPRAAG